ncbi:Na+/H+ antiporter complex subunit E MrpE [Thermosynechococcus sp. NK55a]|jgi:multicomponent Na+:H+ antiporter subunit E|uniref:Na+/H+ antiporter subunit E n=2 Tax=Thermosynechococcus TaxID=146785 RepID=UPI0003D7B5C9|nr:MULTISPECIES: Na+/H+ antiporter subunit E [unclassified Thermosynechococcus]AHB88461.1 Na+/H+ antiporter complex subunit E MrpE [Thermosynechococcus sp. NK55a]RMH65052.1 MAG: cation:proton antiporter [Cyanobacteria bacterium J003]HIK22801.1 Na+/H+ antiporter subunit E [Thermosynechococcus sp. M3746_W2019_013]
MNYLNVALCLTIWLLLTADFGLVNLVIGILVSLLLPQGRGGGATLQEWLSTLGKVAMAVPRAYLEAIEMIVRPHRHEAILREPVDPTRAPGLIFLDIFTITFTPKTIVLRYDEEGWFEVHQLVERRPEK